MKLILPFYSSYSDFYNYINNLSLSGSEVLEIGGGAHPSIKDRQEISYTIVDPDTDQTDLAPKDVKIENCRVQSLDSSNKYDIVISKMVLEHIEDPLSFHSSVYELLRPGGRAIHFYACKYSLPSIVNRILPEKLGELILKKIENRELNESPKYPAYYINTQGSRDELKRFYGNMGYTIETINFYLGHTYLKNVPVLNILERFYSYILYKAKLKTMASVSLLILKK